MEKIFAIIGVVAVLALIAGVIAAVIGTLRYLDNNPETEMERHQRILKSNATLEHSKQLNKNN